MPLAKIEKINNSSWWAFWEITENESQLESLLQEGKTDRDLATISHPQKRLEWYAGRLAVKSLTEIAGAVYSGVIKDENNKPFIAGSSINISITHSFPYAAAILNSSFPVGIDIEKPREKLLKVAKRFLSPEERAICGSDLHKLCIYWCAKEALYKKFGDKKLIFDEQIHVLLPDSGDDHCIKGIIYLDNSVVSNKLIYHLINEHIICYNID